MDRTDAQSPDLFTFHPFFGSPFLKDWVDKNITDEKWRKQILKD